MAKICNFSIFLGLLHNFKEVGHDMMHLASNQLSSFPLAFSGLTQLDLLDLSNNSITALPAEISSLHAFELNLNNNKVIQRFDSLYFPDIEHPLQHLSLLAT